MPARSAAEMSISFRAMGSSCLCRRAAARRQTVASLFLFREYTRAATMRGAGLTLIWREHLLFDQPGGFDHRLPAFKILLLDSGQLGWRRSGRGQPERARALLKQVAVHRLDQSLVQLVDLRG